MREHGYSFHRVIVPAQRPADGVIKLQVLQFRIAEVTVAGNQHFSNENVLRSVPALQAGKTPDLRELSRDLSLANEHPAKRLTINIKESRTPDALDAEVRVIDVPSQQTFIALTGGTRDADNTINQNTGYTRLTLGHQQSNLFDLDHALTMTYTTSPDHIEDVQQIGVFYWLPLYGYNTALRAFWTRSPVSTRPRFRDELVPRALFPTASTSSMSGRCRRSQGGRRSSGRSSFSDSPLVATPCARWRRSPPKPIRSGGTSRRSRRP